MLYRITDVNNRKNIGRADTSVVGRIVDFDLFNIRKHAGSSEPVLIQCVTDSSGVPYSPRQKVSMPLKNILSINWFYGKKTIVIEDREAIYTFDKVEK